MPKLSKTLVHGLNWPTYIAFDYKNQHLFVCNSGQQQIVRYEIERNLEETNSHTLEAVNKTVLVREVQCAGMEVDEQGSLFYVDRKD